MKLRFEIIAHHNQAYPTVGNWYQRKGVWWFTVSRMKDKRYVWLVFIHEVIEWSLCRLWGIKQRQVDKFDKAYEQARKGGIAPCGCKVKDEPGADIHAPYYECHGIATECERLIAKALDVDWVLYDEAISKL